MVQRLWRRRKPSRAMRRLVLWGLRQGEWVSVHQVAAECNDATKGRVGREKVCAALDALRIDGVVESDEDGKFRKVRSEA